MTIPPVALKRKHHRLLLCKDTKKKDLLAKLIFENEGKRIAVAVFDDAESIYVPEGIALLMDGDPCEAAFDLLISYDLPADPQLYFSRLALTEATALTLMGESDQPHLLAIETLLGRAISQERPEGYAPELPAQSAPKLKQKRIAKRDERSPREKRPEKAPFKKNSKPGEKRAPKASGVSRFIGLDENGKPQFTGKTGERNHRHDGKPYDDENLAAKKEWDAKRKKQGGEKSYGTKKKPPYQDGKKPYEAKKGDSRPEEKKSQKPKPKRPMIRIKAEKLNPKTPKK